MSLLLLFSDQVAAAASGDVVTTMLVETTAGVWYDATSDLISGNVTRGKQQLLDQYQAGTCEVLLDNDDRKYDPTYAASPLNGHILPMKRVQLRNTYAGVTYPMFAGYADRWTQNREGPHRGTTSLAATDGFKVLERANLAASAFAQEVATDGPVAWWRFDEATGPPAVDNVGSFDLTDVTGAPVFGADPLISRDPGAAVTLTGADGVWRLGSKVVGTGPLTFEIVCKITSGSGTVAAMIVPGNLNGLALDEDGALGFQISTGVNADNATSSVDYSDGATPHGVGTWAANGMMAIYVDGVDTTSSFAYVPIGTFDGATAYTSIGNFPMDTFGFVGTVDEMAIYDYALSAARIAAHAETVATPWNGDLTGARITRVLDAVGWPTTDRNIDTGQTTLQSAELDMTALEHAQKVAETEFGNFYVTAGGTMRFEDRNSAVDQAAVFAFSDAAGAGLPVTFSDPEISDDQIRNDVTVSRLEGVAQNVRDADSITTYQISSYTRDGLYNDSDDYSRNLAQFILGAYKDPVERVSHMAVNPYRDPATLWPAVLGLELTDRITLAETPQWVTPAVTRTLVVEGITHTFAAKSWSASYALSESTAQTQAYWKLGVAGFSELGETTRLFF